MKIKFDIQEKYNEIELHLCNKEKNHELVELRDTLENLFDIKIKVYKEHKTTVLIPSKIVRIYAENKKVYIRTKDNCYEVKERIYTLEEQLKNKGFTRISNSEIVNIHQIQKLDMSYAGTIKMYMKNEDETFVSRRYVKKIKEELS